MVSLIGRVAYYSFQRYIVIFMGILVLGLLAGSTSQPPVGIPQVSPPLPWSSWLSNAPVGLVRNTIVWCSASLIALVLVFLILLVIFMVLNPKNRDGTKSSRKKILQDGIRWFTNPQNIGKVLARLLVLFLFILVWNLMISLISFIGSNKIIAGMSSGAMRLGLGWDRFFLAALVLYVTSAVFLLNTTRMSANSNNSDKPEKDPTRKYSAGLYVFVIIIGIIIPVYSLGIYPTLPQQVGGGRMVPVEAITSSEKLDQFFSESEVEVYLLDQSSRRSLFLLVNTQQQTQLIMEVSNSQVQSITYKSFP